MLSLQADSVVNTSYQNLLWGQYLKRAQNVVDNLASSQEKMMEMPLKLVINGRPKRFLLSLNALTDDTGKHVGIVMVFDERTEPK